MGGIVGRLFVSCDHRNMTILVSAFVALTLSPMMSPCTMRDESMCARPLYLVIERGFTKMLEGYSAGLILC